MKKRKIRRFAYGSRSRDAPTCPTVAPGSTKTYRKYKGGLKQFRRKEGALEEADESFVDLTKTKSYETL